MPKQCLVRHWQDIYQWIEPKSIHSFAEGDHLFMLLASLQSSCASNITGISPYTQKYL
jgi:hypothetical protein